MKRREFDERGNQNFFRGSDRDIQTLEWIMSKNQVRNSTWIIREIEIKMIDTVMLGV